MFKTLLKVRVQNRNTQIDTLNHFNIEISLNQDHHDLIDKHDFWLFQQNHYFFYKP